MAWTRERTLKNGRKVWYVQWRGEDGKVRHMSVRDQGLLPVWEKHARMPEGSLPAKRDRGEDGLALLEQYLDELSLTKSAATLARYRVSLVPMFKTWADRPVTKWTKADFVAYAKAKTDAKAWSPRTLQIVLGNARRFIRWCHDEYVPMPDFVRGIPMPSVSSRVARPLKPAEAAALLAAARTRYARSKPEYRGHMPAPWLEVAVAMGVYAGLDTADIASLRWSEVDLTSGAISRLRKKTGTPEEIELSPPLLRILKIQRMKAGVGADLVCPEIPKSSSSRSKALRRLFKHAGVAWVPGQAWHRLRQTCASIAESEGTPGSTVGDMLCHAPNSAARLHYARQDKARRRAAFESVAESITKAADAAAEAG